MMTRQGRLMGFSMWVESLVSRRLLRVGDKVVYASELELRSCMHGTITPNYVIKDEKSGKEFSSASSWLKSNYPLGNKRVNYSNMWIVRGEKFANFKLMTDSGKVEWIANPLEVEDIEEEDEMKRSGDAEEEEDEEEGDDEEDEEDDEEEEGSRGSSPKAETRKAGSERANRPARRRQPRKVGRKARIAVSKAPKRSKRLMSVQYDRAEVPGKVSESEMDEDIREMVKTAPARKIMKYSDPEDFRALQNERKRDWVVDRVRKLKGLRNLYRDSVLSEKEYSFLFDMWAKCEGVSTIDTVLEMAEKDCLVEISHFLTVVRESDV
eukprot:TRINITY_DN804_c1_g1_i1.p2 TRINITY_DN804_c1_g1~~TRINITY_DN804_c1_g1_i1.p2  ORF type:complete len:323 (+),score=98.79 TRINITY_DN804_c1_g1_i1:126-1094(+)